jgi:hypothetical protein
VAFPGPGWGFASPRTAITFSGGDPGAVSVAGSVSGPVPGALHALRGRPGAVFTPARPFQPGELVSVRTEAMVDGRHEFSFTVAQPARPGRPKLDLTHAWRYAPRRGSPPIGSCRPRRPRLRSLPELRPAGWCVSRRPTERTADGHLLVTPRSRPEWRRRDQHGVMILSSRGQLLWYSPRPHVARDLKTVSYRGERLLAFYQRVPRGRSHYVLLDRRYRPVTRVRPRYGYVTDTHELQLTRRGTAYVSSYQPVHHRGLGRLVTDYVIQEIDLSTGDVLFEWHALDHVAPSASYQPPPAAPHSWDYFHGNSIEPPDAGGTIVVSARNTSAVYGIDRRTGALRWTLGGKLDEFGLRRRQQFCAQHDARRGLGGRLTIFDDGGLALGDTRECPLHRARVQIFRLDLRTRRARVVRTIRSQPSSDDGSGLYVWAMGSAQRQPNGNVLIDWGTTGRITEVTPQGDVVHGLQLEYYSYRAVRSRWRGSPTGRPAVAARSGTRVLRVWASWNGATEVARWRVLAGRSERALRRAGSSRFAGLETLIRLRSRARYVAVEALDAGGSVLRRSATVPVG